MKALVLVLTYIVGAKHGSQSIGIISYHSASVYEAHALGSRLGGHSIVYATAELFDCDGSGEAREGDAAL